MAQKYLTKERHDALVAELNELRTNGRGLVSERLRHAKDLGDLSENAEYQAAREEQSLLEQKIVQLEELLKASSIIEEQPKGGTAVRLGSKVSLEKDGALVEYTIVGSNEADPFQDLISNESPLGRELLGKNSGEAIQVQTPKGVSKYTIVKIQ